ncbi:MAG TPA: ABC transporter permease [Candidatus Ozemobacteraceae bacterium]|nr:ABC transporter permease [Candidatus Ozemobacteraceae bacterium]
MGFCLGKKPTATIVGVGDHFLEASRFDVVKGRFLDSYDQQFCQPVAVVSHGIAKELFGEYSPLGRAIQIGKIRFRVIGVMQEQAQGKGRLAIKSRDHDRDVYIPLRCATERIFKWPFEDREIYHEVSSLWLTVREGYDLPMARDVLMRLLKRRHRDVEDVEALVPIEILQQSQKTQRLFNLVMAFIAALSLLVGGIGIMNIMLATVNERTREIGLRRAIGASRQDIVVQILTEAVLISVFGGILGIVVGIALSLSIATWTGWTTVIPLFSVVLAFSVSVGVGVIFGLFPAMKAASLDPVVALRYE